VGKHVQPPLTHEGDIRDVSGVLISRHSPCVLDRNTTHTLGLELFQFTGDFLFGEWTGVALPPALHT
jgi:hypothetical protein